MHLKYMEESSVVHAKTICLSIGIADIMTCVRTCQFSRETKSCKKMLKAIAEAVVNVGIKGGRYYSRGVYRKCLVRWFGLNSAKAQADKLGRVRTTET